MPYLWGFKDAVHGAVVQQRQLDIIANNLANVNTAGFKGDRVIFNDLMTRQIKCDFSQGGLENTNDPLHLAIGGDGFFQVRTPEGVRLTRNGTFTMRGDGTLVNMDGRPVLDDGGANITINPNGPTVSIDAKGGVHQGQNKIAQLAVVDVKDKQTLEKVGNNLFSGQEGKDPQTIPAQDFTIYQGSIEKSNINTVLQMATMITAHRSFESYQKAIQAMQTIDDKAANQVGRVD